MHQYKNQYQCQSRSSSSDHASKAVKLPPMEMLPYIFKMSCWKPKAQAVPSWARKLKTWKKGTEKPADHHKNIHQKAKIQNNDFVFIFFCKTFHVHIYFQWRCKLFQCFIVQGLFSDFPHQISSLVWPKEPLPSPIKGSCCALPPTAWLHSAQKFLHEFPCWMINFGVVK